MNAVEALRALGYSVTADGDTVRLAFTGAGQPEPAVVRPLLAELRAAKAQALAYLRDEAIPVIYRSEAAEEAWWAAVFAVRGMADPTVPDPDAAEAVIKPGQWYDGEVPEAPPAWHDERPLQEWFDVAMASSVMPGGWPEKYAASWVHDPQRYVGLSMAETANQARWAACGAAQDNGLRLRQQAQASPVALPAGARPDRAEQGRGCRPGHCGQHRRAQGRYNRLATW
jgi:hypothetical protein